MQSCSNITCSDGFYCGDGFNACIPLCGTWSQYSESVNIAIDFFILLSTCFGMLGGIGVLIVAGIRWKKVYVKIQEYACDLYAIVSRNFSLAYISTVHEEIYK